MEHATIGVTSAADRLLADGLEELRPLFDELADGLLVVGGLMTRAWLHARPIGMPPRATADIDIGVDRRALHLVGERTRVGPLLRDLGFEPRMGDEQFRFEKRLGDRVLPVDLGIAPGMSREEPPLLEPGITTIAMPGLAYAVRRRTAIELSFVEDERSRSFQLPMPTLDAAFVLKGGLVGVRRRTDRLQRDTIDAISLAAACLRDEPSLRALAADRKRSDVKAALGWLTSSFTSTSSAAARRVQRHFEDELDGIDGAQWSVEIASSFSQKLEGLSDGYRAHPGD